MPQKEIFLADTACLLAKKWKHLLAVSERQTALIAQRMVAKLREGHDPSLPSQRCLGTFCDSKMYVGHQAIRMDPLVFLCGKAATTARHP
jgi:hypothetical protein